MVVYQAGSEHRMRINVVAEFHDEQGFVGGSRHDAEFERVLDMFHLRNTRRD